MVAWKKIMGKFEVGHWMGAQKRGGGNAGKGTKDFGPVPAIHTTDRAIKKALKRSREGFQGRAAKILDTIVRPIAVTPIKD